MTPGLILKKKKKKNNNSFLPITVTATITFTQGKSNRDGNGGKFKKPKSGHLGAF